MAKRKPDVGERDQSGRFTKKKTTKPTTLLDLPTELRINIFERVLIMPKRVTVNANSELPSLLKVNRQLLKEGGDIFLKNTFNLEIYEAKIAPHRRH